MDSAYVILLLFFGGLASEDAVCSLSNIKDNSFSGRLLSTTGYGVSCPLSLIYPCFSAECFRYLTLW
jgi:hypothetical protein